MQRPRRWSGPTGRTIAEPRRSEYLDLCVETIEHHVAPLELRVLARDDAVPGYPTSTSTGGNRCRRPISAPTTCAHASCSATEASGSTSTPWRSLRCHSSWTSWTIRAWCASARSSDGSSVACARRRRGPASSTHGSRARTPLFAPSRLVRSALRSAGAGRDVGARPPTAVEGASHGTRGPGAVVRVAAVLLASRVTAPPLAARPITVVLWNVVMGPILRERSPRRAVGGPHAAEPAAAHRSRPFDRPSRGGRLDAPALRCRRVRFSVPGQRVESTFRRGFSARRRP